MHSILVETFLFLKTELFRREPIRDTLVLLDITLDSIGQTSGLQLKNIAAAVPYCMCILL